MDHAATMRQAYDLINARDMEGFAALLSDDFVEHEELAGLAPTKDGVIEFFRMQLEAFPDLRMTAEDVIASGDRVVARFRLTGTHEGEFLGIPATGKSVNAQGVDIIRFDESGTAIEHWGVFDALAMMQQLGVIPEGSA